MNFSELIGKTLKAIAVDEDSVVFITDENERYRLAHSQDCCERVTIEDIAGDLVDLIGLPINQAEEATNHDEPRPEDEYGYTDASFTWTFYKLATVKGYVTIRFYGTSNGYYSETVDFEKIGEKNAR